MRLSLAIFTSIILISCNSNTENEKTESVKIGNQIWSLNNLNTEVYSNGDSIIYAKTKVEWEQANQMKKGAYCYYNDDAEFGKSNGKLYNWYAVNDERGIAPKGWQIPTKEDWTVLFDAIGGVDVAGTAMKNSEGWGKDEKGNDGNGSNSSGFTGTPSGYRNPLSEFALAGYAGGWWSKTPLNEEKAWGIHNASNIECATEIAVFKNSGGSIRLVKAN